VSDVVEYQREFYDRHFARRAAAVTDPLAHPLFCSFNDRLARRAFDLAGLRGPGTARVLEVGCGEGLLADAIRRTADERGLVLTYTGLDVSDSALELARAHVEGTLLCGDATDVVGALPAGSQDLVIAKNLLHHLDDPAAFLREARRVTTPGGVVVAFEPNLGCPQFLLFNLLAFKRERYYFRGQRRNRRAFADAGLQVSTSDRFSWLPYELAFVIRYDWFRRLFSTGRPSVVDAVSRLDDRLARNLSPLACYTVWAASPPEPTSRNG
jgi:SAM-dependent methyltransferase